MGVCGRSTNGYIYPRRTSLHVENNRLRVEVPTIVGQKTIRVSLDDSVKRFFPLFALPSPLFGGLGWPQEWGVSLKPHWLWLPGLIYSPTTFRPSSPGLPEWLLFYLYYPYFLHPPRGKPEPYKGHFCFVSFWFFVFMGIVPRSSPTLFKILWKGSV